MSAGSPEQPPFVAALLAGGKSSRMGTDKALLDWDGIPLWRFQIGKLIALNPGRLLLSCRQEQPLKNIFAEFVFDPPDNPGPLGAIVRCLEVLGSGETGPLLVLAVDMPQMTARFLQSMIEASAGSSRGIVSRYRDDFEPLCAVYPHAALELMRDLLAGGMHRMQDVIARLVAAELMTVRDLREDEVPLFFNANTPDEYAWTKPAAPASN